MGDFLSFIAGASLLVMSALVMRAYAPRFFQRQDAPSYLATAIFLGFLSAGGNTLYWQVFGQIAVNWGWMSVPQLRGVGDFVDVLVKGSGAVAGWLHLKAIHESLSAKERRNWMVIEMAFYPQRRVCLRAVAETLKKVRAR